MKKHKLQQYFPLIRTRNEILSIINSTPSLYHLFQQWNPMQQEEFLDFCSGARGVKMLYDSFAKAILNPEVYPERLNELLSLLLGTRVTILEVLPNDNSRITDESSLVIMDILVQLENGSIVNIEVQKEGYRFPGQRSACYSADLLLRQYIRVRGQKAQAFSYRDIKNVYTIVLFEGSPKEFHSFPDNHLHFFEQKSDTGLDINLLQKYVFIPLDIFLKNHHNKPINNRLEAWLLFLSSDKPEDIISIITAYPDFKAMYDQVYEICRNMEEVMRMFSEELKILDRNTVKLMIDEMKEELEQQKQELEQQKQELEQQKQELKQKNKELESKDQKISVLENEITKLKCGLSEA